MCIRTEGICAFESFESEANEIPGLQDSICLPAFFIKAELFRRPRRVSGMFGVAMCVAKVKITQVDREREQVLQNADGIVPVDRKVTQDQQRTDRAAFPETEGNHAFFRALRSDPLNNKAEAEDEAPAQSNDLPWIESDAEHSSVGQEVQAVHRAKTFCRNGEAEQLFVHGAGGAVPDNWSRLFIGEFLLKLPER